jgi:hypothetical protein
MGNTQETRQHAAITPMPSENTFAGQLFALLTAWRGCLYNPPARIGIGKAGQKVSAKPV